ncbi:hypothetical protein amrb99_63160 [Actinomadura sp. RB99]|uniref:hypothetical protein n=1 Tax=Actinomadura sp. RB99 TaxID=2691577 RepID=UPI0016871588|nr:hypothetical protein [Actinomadura sp. RB99]MBD2897356.1 hypothetical protein [Actinomadura sp. RB99]
MTAIMPERPTLHDRVMAALEPFFADAHIVARYHSHLLNAMRSAEVYVAHVTVRGVPVTVTGLGCGMTLEQADETGQLIYSLPLEAWAHIFIEGPGRVRVGANGPEVTA